MICVLWSSARTAALIALLACAAAFVVCCKRGGAPSLPQQVLVYGNAPDDSFPAALVTTLRKELPDVDVRVFQTPRSLPALSEIERGQVDVTLAQADSVYFQHQHNRSGDVAFSRVRAVATLHSVPVHVLVKGAPAEVLRPARGRIVRTNAAASSLRRLLLETLGIPSASIREVPAPESDMLSSTHQLIRGDIDVLVIAAYHPWAGALEAIRGGAHLVPLETSAIEKVVRAYPFTRPMVLPAGTYPSQSEPLQTVSVDMVLVCRRDLDEDLAYRVTKHVVRTVPLLSSRFPGLLEMEMEEASQTPIPLHEGSARYYRESELLP
jgi:TRAP transporter TAXI family solute receptor